MTLQISGFVKNLPNGSVEMEAEGEDPKLTDLLRWCHHGPPGARVDRVDVEWLPPTGVAAAFSVQG
jgi:acylphosphatase